jgi:predicted nucleic acid-binding protein
VTYLVDANVLSEATRPTPNTRVVSWLRRNEADLAVDPIVVGEIRFKKARVKIVDPFA